MNYWDWNEVGEQAYLAWCEAMNAAAEAFMSLVYYAGDSSHGLRNEVLS